MSGTVYRPSVAPVGRLDYTDPAAGLNYQQVTQDPRFEADLRATFNDQTSPLSELQTRFLDRANWRELNLASQGRNLVESMAADQDGRDRMARLQRAADLAPSFWQDGGRGTAEALPSIASSILADPTNLLPVGRAFQAAAAATRAGRTGGQALGAGVRSGAVGEGLLEAGTSAVGSGLDQASDNVLGLESGFSLGQVGIEAAAGGVLGGALGGALSIPAALAGRRTGRAQVDALTGIGYTPDQIASMPDAQVGPAMDAGGPPPPPPSQSSSPAPGSTTPRGLDTDLSTIETQAREAEVGLEAAYSSGDEADRAKAAEALIRTRRLREANAELAIRAQEYSDSTDPAFIDTYAKARAAYRSALDNPSSPDASTKLAEALDLLNPPPAPATPNAPSQPAAAPAPAATPTPAAAPSTPSAAPATTTPPATPPAAAAPAAPSAPPPSAPPTPSAPPPPEPPPAPNAPAPQPNTPNAPAGAAGEAPPAAPNTRAPAVGSPLPQPNAPQAPAPEANNFAVGDTARWTDKRGKEFDATITKVTPDGIVEFSYQTPSGPKTVSVSSGFQFKNPTRLVNLKPRPSEPLPAPSAPAAPVAEAAPATPTVEPTPQAAKKAERAAAAAQKKADTAAANEKARLAALEEAAKKAGISLADIPPDADGRITKAGLTALKKSRREAAAASKAASTVDKSNDVIRYVSQLINDANIDIKTSSDAEIANLIQIGAELAEASPDEAAFAQNFLMAALGRQSVDLGSLQDLVAKIESSTPEGIGFLFDRELQIANFIALRRKAGEVVSREQAEERIAGLFDAVRAATFEGKADRAARAAEEGGEAFRAEQGSLRNKMTDGRSGGRATATEEEHAAFAARNAERGDSNRIPGILKMGRTFSEGELKGYSILGSIPNRTNFGIQHVLGMAKEKQKAWTAAITEVSNRFYATSRRFTTATLNSQFSEIANTQNFLADLRSRLAAASPADAPGLTTKINEQTELLAKQIEKHDKAREAIIKNRRLALGDPAVRAEFEANMTKADAAYKAAAKNVDGLIASGSPKDAIDEAVTARNSSKKKRDSIGALLDLVDARMPSPEGEISILPIQRAEIGAKVGDTELELPSVQVARKRLEQIKPFYKADRAKYAASYTEAQNKLNLALSEAERTNNSQLTKQAANVAAEAMIPKAGLVYEFTLTADHWRGKGIPSIPRGTTVYLDATQNLNASKLSVFTTVEELFARRGSSVPEEWRGAMAPIKAAPVQPKAATPSAPAAPAPTAAPATPAPDAAPIGHATANAELDRIAARQQELAKLLVARQISIADWKAETTQLAAAQARFAAPPPPNAEVVTPDAATPDTPNAPPSSVVEEEGVVDLSPPPASPTTTKAPYRNVPAEHPTKSNYILAARRVGASPLAKDSMRVVGSKNALSDNPLANMLGVSIKDDWEVGYVPRSAKTAEARWTEFEALTVGADTNTPMAYEDFLTLKADDISAVVSPQEMSAIRGALASIAASDPQKDLPQNNIAKANASSILKLISSGGGLVPTGRDLLTLKNMLSDGVGFAEIPKTREAFDSIIAGAKAVESIVARLAPGGINYDLPTKAQSVAQIKQIMGNYGAEVADEAARLIDSLNITNGPMFVDATGSGQWGVGQRGDIKLDASTQNFAHPATPIQSLFHEVGHWILRRGLTPAERAEVMSAFSKGYYDSDGNLLTGVVDQRSPMLGINSRSNLDEVFANQFAAWVTQKRLDPKFRDITVWDKITSLVQKIFQAFKNPDTLDPALDAIFTRVMPDGSMPSANIVNKTKDQTAVVLKGKVDALRISRSKMDEAIASDNPESIISAANDIVSFMAGILGQANRAKGFGFNPLGAFDPRKGANVEYRSTVVMYRKLMDAIKPKGGEDASNLSASGTNRGAGPEDGGDAVDGDERVGGFSTFSAEDIIKAADRIQNFYEDGRTNLMAQDQNGRWIGEDGKEIPAAIAEAYIAKNRMSLSAQLELMEQRLIQVYDSRPGDDGVPGGLPPGTPANFWSTTRYTPKSLMSASAAEAQAKKMQREANAQALIGADEAVLAARTRAKAFPKPYDAFVEAYRANPDYPKDAITANYDELLEMARSETSDGVRQRYIGFEIYARLRAQDGRSAEELANSIGKGTLTPKVTQALKSETNEDLQINLYDAIMKRDDAKRALYEWEIARRIQKRRAEGKTPTTSNPDLIQMLRSEIASFSGGLVDDGIPADARPAVQEALSKLTHRDGISQQFMRRAAYRIFSLLGRQDADSPAGINQITIGDFSRLMGTDASNIPSAPLDYSSPEFLDFRRQLRRAGQAMASGDNNTVDEILMPMLERIGKADPSSMEYVSSRINAADIQDAKLPTSQSALPHRAAEALREITDNMTVGQRSELMRWSGGRVGFATTSRTDGDSIIVHDRPSGAFNVADPDAINFNNVSDEYLDFATSMAEQMREAMLARSSTSPEMLPALDARVERMAANLEKLGVEIPRLKPVALRLRQVADLSPATTLDMGDNLVETVLNTLEGQISTKAANKLIDQLAQPKAGDVVFRLISEALGPDGDNRLRQAVINSGFDALRTGKRVDGTPEISTEIFRPDSAVRDLADTDYGSPEFRDDDSILGLLVSEIATARTPPNVKSASAVGEALTAGGATNKLAGAISRIFGGKAPTSSDVTELRKSADLQFRSNSSRFRKIGMEWMAGWLENYFPDFGQTLAAKYLPYHNALNSLPDAPKGVAAWAQRIQNNLVPESFSKLAAKQPESWERIHSALRRPSGSRQENALSPDELKIYHSIRLGFQNEFKALRDSGVIMGDLGPDYFPQIWQSNAIGRDRNAFLDLMKDYYIAESRSAGRRPLDIDAEEFAQNIYSTIAEEGGVHIPRVGMTKNANADAIDFNRMINLDKFPDLKDRAEAFLERDLQTILVKYYDASTRRIMLNDQFGVNRHAYDDYMHTVQNGIIGAAELLTTRRVVRKQNQRLNADGIVEREQYIAETPMPFEGKFETAVKVIDEAHRRITENGGSIESGRQFLLDMQPEKTKAYAARVEAIVNALADYKGKPNTVAAKEYAWADGVMRVAMKKPVSTSQTMMNGDTANSISRGVRSFNNISLLGFAAISSAGDAILPLVRTADMKSFVTGMTKFASDPHYRKAIYDTGIALENVVAEKMIHAYGTWDGKATNAFFSANMMTPWSTMTRGAAAAVGHVWFENMRRRAADLMVGDGRNMAEQTREFKTSMRFLNRYGLGDYVYNGTPITTDSLESDQLVRRAVYKFADDAVFAPNPNDIPTWAQTPIGSVVFQLKSFPLMMGRLAKDIVLEAKEGNVKPLLTLLTVAPMAGVVSLGAKDLIQSRGGQDNNEVEFRRRNMLKFLGYDEKIHGDENTFLGWYAEGLMMSGGFGILTDMLHSTVTQVDNGSYGANRVLSTVFGPSVGLALGGFNVAAGIGEQLSNAMSGEDDNSKTRIGFRELVNRVPIAGRVGSFGTSLVDTLAGERKGRSGNGGGDGGWGGNGGSGW